MSEQAPENAPKPQEGQQEGQQPEAKSETRPEGKAVEFDGPFDEDRAKRLIENLRGDLEKKNQREQDLAAKVKEFEDLSKTEQEKLADSLVEAEQRAEDAEQKLLRAEVASEKGLTPAQAKRLTGSTKDELEADADELLEVLKPGKPPAPDLKQGVRTTESKGQLSRADLQKMKPEEIVQARKEGRLGDLTAGRNKS